MRDAQKLSISGETMVLGMDVEADEAVIDCLNTALEEANLNWDVLD